MYDYEKEEDLEEQIKLIQDAESGAGTHWTIIRHNNACKVRWDIFIILLVLFNCYTIPMEVAFTQISWMRSKPYEVAEYLIDVSFALDILISFRTTFITPGGNEEYDARIIAKSYLCSNRFVVDLLATIPFEVVISAFLPGGGDLSKYQQFLGMLKLVRLLRLRRIVQLVARRQDFKVGFRIVSLMSVLLMLIHWIGCMWYMFTTEPTLTAAMEIPQGASWVDTALEVADGQFQGK